MAHVDTKPNIVLILIDDLGWRDVGCYGSSFYETPALDEFAADAARFTSAYAAAPVCSPTRASLLTGKYPATVGITQFIGGHLVGPLCDVPYFDRLPTSELSLARALRNGGYQTWHVGKWHLGPEQTWPERHGFDVNIGGCDWGLPRRGFFSPYGIPTLLDGPDGEYLTDRLTDEAIQLIEGADGAPFFLHLSHYAVHIPIQAPEALVEKYRHKAASTGLDQIDPIEAGEPHPSWRWRHRPVERRTLQSDPAYAAMVENLDDNIGRILNALERTGKANDTIVIVTSDNGGLATAEGSPTCNAPLAEGKGWAYDGGVRVPLIVRWPDVTTPGSTIDEPVTTPDFFPTLLEAAGLPLRPEQHVDGVSFAPLLRGEQFTRGPIFWHYPHYSNQGGSPAAAVRDGDWKLIYFYDDDHVELYNLCDDPGEQVQRAPSEHERVTRLRRFLEDWQRQVGAVHPRPNPHRPFADLLGGPDATRTLAGEPR